MNSATSQPNPVIALDSDSELTNISQELSNLEISDSHSEPGSVEPCSRTAVLHSHSANQAATRRQRSHSISNPVTHIPSTPNPPTASAAMSRLNELPPFSAKESPLQFTGISSEANDFLEQYEGLIFKHKLTLESDKVKGILRYCSQNIRDWIENRDAFLVPDWNQLKSDIQKYFDADQSQMPYNLGDVHNFSLRQSRKPITNLEDWHRYLRRYEAIAGRLKNNQIISLEQFHQYLWTGIEAKLRINSVEPEMKRTYPNHDVTRFYSKAEVETVMERMFAQNKADVNIIDAPAFGIPTQSRRYYSDDSDDSDIDEEESDTAYYGRREPRH